MKILNDDYSYQNATFKGENGIWRCVGTKSNGRYVKDCIDTFKNDKTGEFLECKRETILNLEIEGKIKPYIEFKIENNTNTRLKNKRR